MPLELGIVTTLQGHNNNEDIKDSEDGKESMSESELSEPKLCGSLMFELPLLLEFGSTVAQ